MNPQQQMQAPHGSMGPRPPQQPERQDNFIQTAFKQDIAKARELLSDLLNKSSAIIRENIRQPGNQRESQRLRLEKGLEELYAILNQIEMNLKLALQWHHQSLDSKRFYQIPVSTRKTDEAQIKTSTPLQSYMKMVRYQIGAAKELHDFITDTENKLSQASVPMTPVSAGAPANPTISQPTTR